jgi:hypothetical protein
LKARKTAAVTASTITILATAAVALAVNLLPARHPSQISAASPVIQYQNVYDTPSTGVSPSAASTAETTAPPTTVAPATTRVAPAPATMATSGPAVTTAPQPSVTAGPITAPPTTRPTTTSTTPPPAMQTATFATNGGTVAVACTSAFAIRVLAATPADGFQAVVTNPGPQQAGVRFSSAGQGFQVSAVCFNGQPFRLGGTGSNNGGGN